MSIIDDSVARDLLNGIDLAVEVRNAQGMTLYINPAFTREMGYPPQAIVGRQGAEVLGEGWALPTPGLAVACASHCNRYDGGGVACEANASALVDSQGRPIGFFIVRRPMNQEASGARAIDSTSLDDEGLDLSHELRTPLNVIIGYSELLIEDAEKDGRDQVVTDLRRIHQAGKQLQQLFQGLVSDS